ncbi:MAG TPA: hypothetical protein GXZ66_07415 [Clostridiaceae bacterium]|jgi:hypothetical protein|nr:hypothetical protein [Clostridiaceae bacterium]
MMKKGNFGISLTAVAVLCLAFAALGQPVAVLLICAYAVLAEKNTWLTRYTVTTVALVVVKYLINALISGFFGGLAGLFTLAKALRLTVLMGTFATILNGIVALAFLVVYIILAVNAIGGKELKASFIDKIVPKDEETENQN